VPFYASRFDGGGASEEDPFLPRAGAVADADGLPWRALDLRADVTTAAGWCLVWVPQRLSSTPAGVVFLVDAPGDELPAAARDAIAARLGVAVPAGVTLRQLVRRLLTVEAREDGTRWRPARPGRDGRTRFTLGDSSEQLVR